MGMGHSTAVVARARELAAAGWNAADIARRIPIEFPGVTPAATTVRRWIDDDYAERQRLREQTGGVQTRRWGWRRRLARIRQLRDADVAFDAIVKLARLDFGLDLSTQQVEKVARGETSDAGARRLLGGGS